MVRVVYPTDETGRFPRDGRYPRDTDERGYPPGRRAASIRRQRRVLPASAGEQDYLGNRGYPRDEPERGFSGNGGYLGRAAEPNYPGNGSHSRDEDKRGTLRDQLERGYESDPTERRYRPHPLSPPVSTGLRRAQDMARVSSGKPRISAERVAAHRLLFFCCGRRIAI